MPRYADQVLPNTLGALTSEDELELRRLRLAQAAEVPRADGAAFNPMLNADRKIDYNLKAESEQDLLRRQKELSFTGAVGEAFKDTTTAHLWRAGAARLSDDYEEPDEEFKPTTEDYYNVLNEYGLQTDAHTRRRLLSANSAEQMARFGRELKDAQDANQLLGNRWAIQAGVAILDPVENAAMIAASIATAGAAGPAGLSARVARVSGAIAQSTALGGAMLAGRAAGKDYEAKDVALAMGISLPLVYAGTRGQYSHLLRRDDVLARRAQGWEARKMASGEPIGEARRAAEEAPRAADAARAQTSGTVRQAEEELDAAVRADSMNAAMANRERFFNNERRIQDRLRQASHTEHVAKLREQLSAARAALQSKARANEGWFNNLPHTKGYKNAQLKVENAKAAVRSELDELERLERSARGDKYAQQELAAEVRQLKDELKHLERDDAMLDYMNIPREEFIADLNAAKAKFTENPAAEVQRLEYELWQATNYHVPQNAWEADALNLQIARNNVQPNYPVQQEIVDTLDDITASAINPQAAEAVVERMHEAVHAQPGSAGMRPGFVARRFPGVMSLLSEHFKLTRGIPALERYMSKLIEDPLGRAGLQGDNAASRMSLLRRQAANDFFKYNDAVHAAVLERTGLSNKLGTVSYTRKYQEARDAFEAELAQVMLQRNTEHASQRALTASPDAGIMQAAQALETLHYNMLQRAKDHNLKGFEFIEPSPGYFHRSWNGDKMLRIVGAEGEAFVTQMLKESILRSSSGYTAKEAAAVANAIFTRARNRTVDARTDFMGQLGQQDTAGILEFMRKNGVEQEVIDSVSNRLQASMDEAGKSKYAKQRIDMDMTLSFTGPSGQQYRMQDLIDTDLSRLSNNYLEGMTGRAALAHVGIGGDVHGIATFRQHYAAELQKHPLSQLDRDNMMNALDDILSTFTGIPREGAQLGEYTQLAKSLAATSLLGKVGLWQVGEGAVLAARHGFLTATFAMLRQIPGIKQTLNAFKNRPDLVKEWETVMNMQISNDTRIQPWLRQMQDGFGTDSTLHRYGRFYEQAVQVVAGQRWVQRVQTKAALNLHLMQLYKAATGDVKALKAIRKGSDMITDEVLAEVRRAARLDASGNLQSMGLEALSDASLNAVQNAILRLQDTAVLQGRAGWGNSYQHSAVGKLLGQFTNFVTLANNIVLRRTLSQDGAQGIASILLYQFPAMFLSTALAELRDGKEVDFDDSEQIMALAWKALTYSSAMGVLGDAVGFVRGDSRSLAALTPFEAPSKVWGTFSAAIDGDFGTASAEAIGAAKAVSILGAIPGINAIQNSLKE